VLRLDATSGTAFSLDSVFLFLDAAQPERWQYGTAIMAAFDLAFAGGLGVADLGRALGPIALRGPRAATRRSGQRR
jgi:hypothetical protein